MEGTIEYDFKPFKQGIDWSRTIEFKTSGVADDLTGYKAAMTIRSEPHKGGTEYLTITSSSDLGTTPTAGGSSIGITAATGLVTLNITDTDTDAFTWKTGYYDLKIIDASNNEHVPMYGKITVIPKITLITGES